MWNRQSTEALIMCEQDISRMRRQLDETNDELAQIARERDILAHENDNLQEQFSKAKQENQVYLLPDSFSQRKKMYFFWGTALISSCRKADSATSNSCFLLL